MTRSSVAGQQLVHRRRIVAFDEIGRVAVAAEQFVELFVADPRQDGRTGDLVAVQVQDRQHDAVVDGVEELVRVPTCGQRPRLRLAVADDAGDEQIGIVEGGAVGVRDRIAQFAPFVDRAGRLRGDVAGDAAGKRKLREQPLHPLLVLRNLRIQLAIGSFEIGVGHEPRSSVAGSGDVDRVEIVLLDRAVQVDVEKVQSRRGAPVAQQPRLDVFVPQRLFQQRIVVQIDLADRQVVGRPPVGVHFSQQVGRKRLIHDKNSFTNVIVVNVRSAICRYAGRSSIPRRFSSRGRSPDFGRC